jgi:hypothetical protein
VYEELNRDATGRKSIGKELKHNSNLNSRKKLG